MHKNKKRMLNVINEITKTFEKKKQFKREKQHRKKQEHTDVKKRKK